MLPVLQRIIPARAIIYDIGAHIGDHTAFFISLRPRFVYAFEAYPDAQECLQNNMGHYGANLRGRLMIIGEPVGDGEGVDLAPIDHGAQNYGARRVSLGSTASIRLDDLYIHLPTFIQIDVEGWEGRVLAGATHTIEASRPIIVCEINREALALAGDSPEHLHSILAEHGYDMRDIYDGSTWSAADTRPLFDIVARPK